MIGTTASVDAKRIAARIARDNDRKLAAGIIVQTQQNAKPSPLARITTGAIRFLGNHR